MQEYGKKSFEEVPVRDPSALNRRHFTEAPSAMLPAQPRQRIHQRSLTFHGATHHSSFSSGLGLTPLSAPSLASNAPSLPIIYKTSAAAHSKIADEASIHIKRDAIVRRIEGLEKFLDELRTQKAEMDAQIAHLATAAHTRPRPRQVSIRSRPQPLTIVEESEESEESAVAPPVDLPTPPSRIRTCDPDETGGAQSPSDDLDDLMVRSLSPLVLALGTSTPPGPAAVLHIEPAAAAAKPLSPRRSLQTVHLTATAAAAAGPIFQMRSLERSRSVRTVVVHAKARAGASAEGPSGTSPKRRGTAPSASSPSPTLALGLTLRQDGVDRESNVRVETRPGAVLRSLRRLFSFKAAAQ